MPSNTDFPHHTNSPVFPLTSTSNIFTDIRHYFLHRPKIKTLIKFNTVEDRHVYCESIMQRIGIDVDRYRLLNIHRIGIEAPASFLFNELMKWNGDSLCWPNHIAHVNLHDPALEEIQITLFGRAGIPADGKRNFFYPHFSGISRPILFGLEKAVSKIQFLSTAMSIFLMCIFGFLFFFEF